MSQNHQTLLVNLYNTTFVSTQLKDSPKYCKVFMPHTFHAWIFLFFLVYLMPPDQLKKISLAEFFTKRKWSTYPIHCDSFSMQFCAMKVWYTLGSLLTGWHGNKSKALGTRSLRVCHNLSTNHLKTRNSFKKQFPPQYLSISTKLFISLLQGIISLNNVSIYAMANSTWLWNCSRKLTAQLFEERLAG